MITNLQRLFGDVASMGLMIIPLFIFGLNLGFDFFVLEFLKNTLGTNTEIHALLILSGFVGAFVASLFVYIRFRGRPSMDIPSQFKRHLIMGLICGGCGLLCFILALYSALWILFIPARLLAGFGLSLIHIVAYPLIYSTEEEKYRDFLFFFIMGFPSLGHFVANQAGFFTFLSQSPKDSPGFLVTAYLFLLALTILVIIIIKKVPFHLIGTSERWINMENRTKPLSTVTVMALIGLLLYNITDSYLSEIKDFSTKELSTLSQSSDFILFESCLMGGIIIGRFGISVKLSPLPHPIKNIFIILIPTTIFLFVLTLLTTINIQSTHILMYVLYFFIFCALIIASRSNVFSLIAALSVGGIIHSVVLFLIQDPEWQTAIQAGEGFFKAILFPGLMLLAFRETYGSIMALSGLISIITLAGSMAKDFSSLIPEYASAALHIIIPLLLFLYCYWVGITAAGKYYPVRH